MYSLSVYERVEVGDDTRWLVIRWRAVRYWSLNEEDEEKDESEAVMSGGPSKTRADGIHVAPLWPRNTHLMSYASAVLSTLSSGYHLIKRLFWEDLSLDETGTDDYRIRTYFNVSTK